MSRKGIRGAPLPRPWVRLGSLAVLFAATHLAWSGEVSSGNSSNGKSADRAADGKVRCPNCDEKGKAACPRCDGKGTLTRTCRLCEGSGRRSCPQCSKYSSVGGDASASPGQIPCTYCGGRGYLGKRVRKVCEQCGGSRINECPTCRGQGNLSCAKVRPAGICPDCRLTGKITCRICDGSKVAPASLIRREPPPEGDEPPGENPVTVEKPGSPKGEVGLEQRYAELGQSYKRNTEIFSGDTLSKTETVKKGLTELQRRICVSRDDGSPLCSDLTKMRRRADHLLSRWKEISDIYNRFRRSYLGCQKAWKEHISVRAKPVVPGLAPRFDPMQVRMNICERLSRQLEDERPAWLIREGEEIQQLWKPLSQKGKEHLVEIAREASSAAEQATRVAATGGGSHTGSRRSSEHTARRASERGQFPENPGTDAASGTSPETRALPPGTTPPPPEGTSGQLRETAEAASRPRAEPAPAPGSASGAAEGSSPGSAGSMIFQGALWVGSVLLTAYLLLMVSRWRQRRRMSWEDVE